MRRGRLKGNWNIFVENLIIEVGWYKNLKEYLEKKS